MNYAVMALKRGRTRHACGAVLFVTAALVANGCSRLASLAAPSPLWHKVLPEWSPYVVLSSDDGALVAIGTR